MAKREIDERLNGRLALRSLVLATGDSQPMAPRTPRAHTAVPHVGDRRRLERDLHDGVQNELVALIVMLALAQQDPEISPALS